MIPSFYTLEQCDRVTLANNTMPYIKSYYSCLNRVMGDGYSEVFQFTERGIRVTGSKKEYKKGDFTVVNFFRFEGSGNAADNVLMYMLETTDGLKGTLISSNLEEGRDSLFGKYVE